MKSHIVAIVSDIHFDQHDTKLWAGFKAWCKAVKPAGVVVLGDIVDFGMLSTYAQSGSDPVKAINQIKLAVSELNQVKATCGRLWCAYGNHDERWERVVLGARAQNLEGAVGLSFVEQMTAQGLEGVEWFRESCDTPGLILGKKAFMARHGHNQAGRFGIVHISARLLNEQPTISTGVGHHHRAQLACRTHYDGTVIQAIANPHMSGNHEYGSRAPNWQRGFTILEFYGAKRLRDCANFTSQIVIADRRSRFAYGGRVYGT